MAACRRGRAKPANRTTGDIVDDDLLSELAALTDTQLDAVLDGLPPDAVQAILDAVPAKADGRTIADVLESYSIELQPKQALAQKLVDDADELLYGGAAGGGKSFWLLAHAVAQMEMHPGNRGIIFRRVMPSLKRSILPAAVALLHSKAEHNKVDNTFTFPNGSVLEFGHLQHDDSVHTYQGAEYGFIGFEEVTEFLEAQWEFMSSRARAPADGIRPHMVATANPGGVGHRWVKRRWVKPDGADVAVGSPMPSPNTVWQARPQVEGEPPSRRVFIPARLDDNPALLERDPAYRTRLRAITNRALREAMESGDWDAIDQIEGALWEWDWIRRVSPVDVSDYGSVGGMSRVVVAVDPAASAKPGSDETGIVVCGRGYDGDGYVLADRSCRVSPEQWAARAIQAYHDFSADVIVAERNNGGDMVVSVLKGIDPNVPVRTVWASRGKRTRAEPVAALYEHGRVAHAGTFTELEEQLTTWVPDDGDSPDRLDALVWGITDLLVDTSGGSTVQYRNVSLKGTR